MNSKSAPEVSIISTYHAEGIIAHKTILSLLNSAKHLDKLNISYEFIISLDNPDQATLDYFNNWRDDSRFNIFEFSFGNPADNRNSAIKEARGKYISLIDGDDLISENWLLSSYKLIQKLNKPTVLRPAAHVQFGYEDEAIAVWLMRNSLTKEIDAIQMSYWNLWTNALFTTRDILLANPYKASLNGFGFEDYLLNADMRANDIEQVTVPETVLWYRHRIGSVSTEHAGTILDYSKLFEISTIKNIPIEEEKEILKKSSKQRAQLLFVRFYRFSYDTAKKIGPINRAMSPTAKKILYKKKMQRIPGWLIDRWREINTIENQLWPTQGQVAKLVFHPLSFNERHDELGLIYQKLCLSLSGDRIDYIFLAPEMSGRGGTEKLIANYIKAIREVHPSWKIAILSTQPYNQATRDYFSELNVDMLDFGALMAGRSIYERNIIWSRILIQSKVKRLHIINDSYWYHWLTHHQKLIINNGYKIYISLFMREFVHEQGRIQSFADPDLSQIWPTVEKVFTDNQKVIHDALQNNSFNREKMVVHYQPKDVQDPVKPKKINNTGKVRILWASRVSHQKRPDLLKKIANRLGDNYIIDAYGIIEKRQYKQTFFNDSKVNYKGSFNGIQSIPTKDYDIYLYTSQTDGVPNILLEVSAAGLPIVASNVGGIGEFVKNNSTGVLVEMDDIDGYVEAINILTKDSAKKKSLVLGSQSLLRKQHSWERFIDNVRRDIN